MQRASTTTIQALSTTTGCTLMALQKQHLCELIGGGLILVKKGSRTLTRAAALASAVISGPGPCGGVRSPTTCEEVGNTTSDGVR